MGMQMRSMSQPLPCNTFIFIAVPLEPPLGGEAEVHVAGLSTASWFKHGNRRFSKLCIVTLNVLLFFFFQ